MKYLTFLMVTFGLLNSMASCRVHKFKQECESARECVWDSRGCSVGSRPLESISHGKVVEGDTVEDNF